MFVTTYGSREIDISISDKKFFIVNNYLFLNDQYGRHAMSSQHNKKANIMHCLLAALSNYAAAAQNRSLATSKSTTTDQPLL
jgi:hypothetical protein